MRTIDAHLHLWNRADGYHWLASADEALREDFTPERAAAELQAAGVEAAILVQADDTELDTISMLHASDTCSWVVGVVGWVPIDDAKRAEELLDRWGVHPRFRGVRQLLHDDPRDGLLLAAPARRLAAVLADRGLPLDLPNAFPRLLRDATGLARLEEGLTIVVDHLAKPPRDDEAFERWATELAAAAASPNVVAKVSGLNRAGRPFVAADVRRAWDTALACFGPERLMLGGDWPMTVTSGGYGAVWHELSGLVDELSPAERDALRGGTATRVYRLDPRGPVGVDGLT
ncbi:amidohydrolase family protein [Plantibacter sp. MPB07]|uniref:amidohydrolase family protein n=1 Tax=Plantibacter sp. MPB07 TaxID=3388853 RepID=UPI0039886A74